jgi:hypothetical protein
MAHEHHRFDRFNVLELVTLPQCAKQVILGKFFGTQRILVDDKMALKLHVPIINAKFSFHPDILELYTNDLIITETMIFSSFENI